MDILVPTLTLVIGVLAGGLGVLVWTRRSGDPEVGRALAARGEDQAVIRAGLDRLHERMRDLDTQRASWQSQLHEQVREIRSTTDTLRRETSALSTALRRPQVRGQWGEMHLRRSVELAGMLAHCDFEEQVHVVDDDGAVRPDLVVRLAGDKCVVVDAKVPLDGYLDALATADAAEQAHHLDRHAHQLRRHVDQLSSKAYWRRLRNTPEFVVLFVPSESFLSAAFEADPSILEYAAARNVVLASPTTLIALLRTVAHGWTTETLAERTREIHELGRQLYERLGKVGAHFDTLGRSLKRSVEAYNQAIGSLESRVLVTARTFADISDTRDTLSPPAAVSETPRALTAPELLDAVADARPELDFTHPAPGQQDRHGVASAAERLRDLP